jgi:hypothetical protein
MTAGEIAPLGEVPLDEKVNVSAYGHGIITLLNKSRYGGVPVPYLLPCPSCQTGNCQLPLFQLFHFWHALPGFSSAAFFRSSQKAASFSSASALNAFFIPIHLLSLWMHRLFWPCRAIAKGLVMHGNKIWGRGYGYWRYYELYA